MILRMTKKVRDKIRKKYFIFTEAKSLYSLVYDSKGINSPENFFALAKNLVKASIEENFNNIRQQQILNITNMAIWKTWG